MHDLRNLTRARISPIVLVPAALAAITGSLTWGDSAAGLPLHDALAGAAQPPLISSVVLEVSAPSAAPDAVAAARAAGAEAVWSPFPGPHALDGGLPPAPVILVPGSDGRTRGAIVDGVEIRGLPLPEALTGLVLLGADQLGRAPPADLLAGADVVLAYADPALGLKALSPGSPAPVDRARLVAVALGVARAHAGLSVLPRPLAGGGVAALTLLWWGVLSRRRLALGAILGGMAVLAVLVGAALGRARGLDLPVGGMLLGVVGASALRPLVVGLSAIRALDQVAEWLGGPAAEERASPSSLAGRAQMLATFAPGCTVVAWRAEGAGAVVDTLVQAGPPAPALRHVPAEGLRGAGWAIEPVRVDGQRIGALGLVGPAADASDGQALLLAVATAAVDPLASAELASADPMVQRQDRALAGAQRMRAAATRWQTWLGGSGLPIGLFDLSGGLLASGEPLRGRIPAGEGAPLLGLLRALTGLDEDVLLTRLREAIGGEPVAPIPASEGEEDVVLAAVGPAGRPLGFVVAVQSASAARQREALQTGLLVAVDLQTRNALTMISGAAARMAREAERPRRDELRATIEGACERVIAALAPGEALLSAEDARRPVPLLQMVKNAVDSLPGPLRARISLDLPPIARPVLGRPAGLARALDLLLNETLGQGGQLVLQAQPTAQGLDLRLSDDSGGLPAQRNPAGGAQTIARSILMDMGGSFRVENRPGAGLTVVITLPYA